MRKIPCWRNSRPPSSNNFVADQLVAYDPWLCKNQGKRRHSQPPLVWPYRPMASIPTECNVSRARFKFL